MPKKVMHYAGGLVAKRLTVLGGWAACCWGDRAEKIRELEQHTYDRDLVTCKRCLRVLEKADEYQREKYAPFAKSAGRE